MNVIDELFPGDRVRMKTEDDGEVIGVMLDGDTHHVRFNLFTDPDSVGTFKRQVRMTYKQLSTALHAIDGYSHKILLGVIQND